MQRPSGCACSAIAAAYLSNPPGVDRMFSADRGETIDPILDEADILALVVNLSDATGT